MINKGKKDKKSAGAGKKSDGNVMVDLGEKHTEKIDRMIGQRLAAAGVPTRGVAESGKPSSPMAAKGGTNSRWTPAQFKPTGMGNSKNYEPWYSKFGKPWLGQNASAVTVYPGSRAGFKIVPVDMEKIAGKLFGGLGLGLVGNRALVRITPLLWQNNSKVLHEGIAFVAGLFPLIFKRNAMTVGVAIPGTLMVLGTLIDMAFNWMGMPKSTLAGAGETTPRQHIDATAAARNKLNSIQNNVNRALQQQPAAQMAGQAPRALPRVVAQQSA